MISKKFLPASIECAVCTKFGDFLCERCGETYCSKFCQMNDWREHRRFCMPIPRLVQRTEAHANGSYPTGRMLMDANASFDATDAIGSVSEHSAVSDSPNLTQEQLVKLTSSLNKMQIERQNPKIDMKSNLSEIEEVLTVTSTTPPTPATPAKTEAYAQKPTVDGKSNAKIEVKTVESPKQRVVLTPPPKKQQNFCPSVKAIQSQMHVTIVHVQNHNTVFVVPTEDYKKWTELIKEVNEYASVAENLKRPPEIGFIILAKPKVSDSFSRGLITRIRAQDDIAKVEFLEYGFTDVVKFTDMKCLPEKLVNACRLVNKIKLNGVRDDVENTTEIVQFLTGLQENQMDLIVKNLEPIEKTAVSAHFNGSLVDTTNFTLISEQIKELGANDRKATVEMAEITEPEKSKMEIEMEGFSGKKMELCILDNSFLHIGCFSAIKTTDMALLGKNDNYINENAASIASGRPFHPGNNETCLAQSSEDKRWYRANTQNKVSNDTYNLLYIDYGNMEVVPVDRIREMRTEFIFPCITVMCFIDGLCDIALTPQAVKRLQGLIVPYNKMTFDEVDYNGEDTICKSTEMLNILKSENLI